MSETVVAELVPIKDLKLSPENPRKEVGDVGELAQSIAAVGVLEPLIGVREKNGKVTILCGTRRLAAAKEAKAGTVPVIVRDDLSEQDRLTIMLIENLQREDLSPLEEARSYRTLLDKAKMSQRDLGDRIGRSQSHISKRLALLDLPAEFQDDVEKGVIGVLDGAALARVADDPDALGAVMEQAGYGYMTIPQAVERQLDERKREQKRAEKIEVLRAKGVRVLADATPYRLPEGAITIGKDGWHAIGQEIDAKKHAKEECHAIAVDLDGDELPVCLDPHQHLSPQQKAAETRAERKGEADDTKRREHQKALKDAKGAREALVVQILKRRVAKATAFDQVASVFVEQAGQDASRVACRVLGIEAIANDWGAASHAAALQKYARDEDVAKAALALAFAYGEVSLGSTYARWDTPLASEHLDWLKSQGYALSKAEKAELAGKGPR